MVGADQHLASTVNSGQAMTARGIVTLTDPPLCRLAIGVDLTACATSVDNPTKNPYPASYDALSQPGNGPDDGPNIEANSCQEIGAPKHVQNSHGRSNMQDAKAQSIGNIGRRITW